MEGEFQQSDTDQRETTPTDTGRDTGGGPTDGVSGDFDLAEWLACPDCVDGGKLGRFRDDAGRVGLLCRQCGTRMTE